MDASPRGQIPTTAFREMRDESGPSGHDVCFFLDGNMVCGADRSKEGERRFMFRVGKGNDAASGLPEGVPMVLGDRQMPGFYFVDAERCEHALLHRWLDVALDHARSLPPK